MDINSNKIKKFTLLFIAATLIACGAKDEEEDTSGRTTDPLIGTWYTEFDGGNSTLVVNSNGTWVSNNEIDDDGTDTYNGGWSNNGNDFDARRQIYTFTGGGFEGEDIYTVEFSSDFNTLSFDEDTWTRQ